MVTARPVTLPTASDKPPPSALIVFNAAYATICDLTVRCGKVDTDGIRVEANQGESRHVKLERVQVELPTTGTCAAINMWNEQATGGQNLSFSLLIDCCISVPGGSNANATAIRFRGPSGSFSRSVGGRILNGRITNVKFGVDLDNCDTWTIMGTALDGMTVPNPNPPDAGQPPPRGLARAFVFGANTAQCAAHGVRIEDVDVALENYGTRTHFETVGGFTAEEIINNGGKITIRANNDPSAPCASSLNVRNFGTRNIFMRPVELGYDETFLLNNGVNYAVPANWAIVRIAGPSGPFSIGSFRHLLDVGSSNPWSGTQLIVYVTVAQPVTLRNEDPTALASERIKTKTGADVTVMGPTVLRFFYDQGMRGPGFGDSMWVYMGAG